MSRPLFERHDLSAKRRVLVVGDIHGRFDLLEQKLNQHDFDPDQDVAILLGDLVDRSEGSVQALDWCGRAGILRVRGNHEQITAKAAFSDYGVLHHLKCGGQWFVEIEDLDERHHWGKTLEDCPIVIEAIVPGGRRIGFVHADVPTRSWSDLENALSGSDERSEYSIAGKCMWSRNRIDDLRTYVEEHGHAAGYDCSVPGIDHVYFGHTILRSPVTVGNCSWIDTGAYRSEILTVAVVAEQIESSSFLKAA